VAEARLALLIGIAAPAHKSARRRVPLLAAPSRRFLAGFVPAMAAGALLTLVFFRAGAFSFLPGTWLLLYGAGVVSGGAASVRIVPLMGACFMAAGTAAALTTRNGGNAAAGRLPVAYNGQDGWSHGAVRLSTIYVGGPDTFVRVHPPPRPGSRREQRRRPRDDERVFAARHKLIIEQNKGQSAKMIAVKMR